MIYPKSYSTDSNSSEKSNNLLLFSQSGRRLRELRENRGITQEDLGNLLGYTRQSIGLKEQGKRQISACELIRFSKALNLSPTEILYLIGIEMNDQ